MIAISAKMAGACRYNQPIIEAFDVENDTFGRLHNKQPSCSPVGTTSLVWTARFELNKLLLKQIFKLFVLIERSRLKLLLAFKFKK